MVKKKVLIIKNISREGPGILEKILQENLIHYKIVDLAKNEKLPTADNFSCLIIMGGPDSANDETKKIKGEIKFIKT